MERALSGGNRTDVPVFRPMGYAPAQQPAAADGQVSHASLARRGILSTWHTMAAHAHRRVAPKIRRLFVESCLTMSA
jgi:hypothetical protein